MGYECQFFLNWEGSVPVVNRLCRFSKSTIDVPGYTKLGLAYASWGVRILENIHQWYMYTCCVWEKPYTFSMEGSSLSKSDIKDSEYEVCFIGIVETCAFLILSSYYQEQPMRNFC
jgi:hypothetical protein